jgi:hypothetical protein
MVFYIKREHNGCYEGLIATGVCAVDREEYLAEVLIRAQSYLGSMVHGFGGNGGCIFNIRYSFVTRAPSFSTSDVAWRIFIGLNGNELTVTYPYENLIAAAPHIKTINDYVETMTTMMNNA